MKPPTFTTLIVALVALWALFLRLHGLPSESLWLDEAYTAYWAAQSVADILLSPLCDAKLFTLLTKLTSTLWGDGDFALRTLSWLATLLSAPLVYLASRQMMDRVGSIALTLTYLVLPMTVFWSRVARPYALLLLGLAAFYALALRLLNTKAPRQAKRLWIGLLCSWVFCLAIHKSSYFFAPLLLVLAWQQRAFLAHNRRFAFILIAIAGAVVGIVGVSEWQSLTFSRTTFANVAAQTNLQPWTYLWHSLQALSWVAIAPPAQLAAISVAKWLAILFATAVALIGIGLLRHPKQLATKQPAQLLLLGSLILPILGMGLMRLAGMPVYLAGRNDLMLLLPAYLLLFWRVSRLRPAWRYGIFLAMFCTANLHHLQALTTGNNPLQRKWDRHHAEAIAAQMGPNDSCVMVRHVYFTTIRYLTEHAKQACYPLNTSLLAKDQPTESLEAFLQRRLQAEATLWLIAPAITTRANRDIRFDGDTVAASKAIKQLSEARNLHYKREDRLVTSDWQGDLLIARYPFHSKEQP